jgi:hypothetical protein
MNLRTLSLTLLLTFTGLLTACETLPVMQVGNEDLDAVRKQLLGEIPLPTGSTINNEQSLILGTGNNWTGRVVARTNGGQTEIFNWLREQYAANGWQLLSSVKAKTSILVLARNDRTITLEISESTLSGVQIILTVAPRNNAVAAPAPQPPADTGRRLY